MPLEVYASNLLRVDLNEQLSGWSVRDLLKSSLPFPSTQHATTATDSHSDLWKLMMMEPAIWAPTIDEYRMRGDHSCSDLNRDSADVFLAAQQMASEIPALKYFCSTFENPMALRMPPSIISNYAQSLLVQHVAHMPGSAYASSQDGGYERELTMGTQLRNGVLKTDSAVLLFIDEEHGPLPPRCQRQNKSQHVVPVGKVKFCGMRRSLLFQRYIG